MLASELINKRIMERIKAKSPGFFSLTEEIEKCYKELDSRFKDVEELKEKIDILLTNTSKKVREVSYTEPELQQILGFIWGLKVILKLLSEEK